MGSWLKGRVRGGGQALCVLLLCRSPPDPPLSSPRRGPHCRCSPTASNSGTELVTPASLMPKPHPPTQLLSATHTHTLFRSSVWLLCLGPNRFQTQAGKESVIYRLPQPLSSTSALGFARQQEQTFHRRCLWVRLTICYHFPYRHQYCEHVQTPASNFKNV